MAEGKITMPERKWKGFQSVTGATSINISGLDIDELFVKINIGSGGNMTSITIPGTALGVSAENFRLGGYRGSNDAQLTTVQISRTFVKTINNWINGNDVLSTTITSVYYR